MVFITIRLSKLRNITAQLVTQECNDVKAEPMFRKLTGVNFSSSFANVGNDARANISSRGFWTTQHQMTFFDVGVFDPNTRRHESKSLQQY